MAERYAIVQASAGQGGFGRIDKATDTTLDRPVAIKTLDPLFKAAPGPEDVERFHREAKALARLSHPNIPAIYDVQFEPEQDQFRIIFEWIEGQTLRQRLQDRGVLSLEEARIYVGQVCSALAHAHEQEMVHRDVKPANVIVAPAGNSCYLVDFGIALRTDDINRVTSGSAPGTPGYMSPEQERGEEITPASDVFSLGVVLYESLAGIRPAVGEYLSLQLHNESYPPGVDELVRQSLSVEPSQRPASARDFIDRFTSALRPHSNFTSVLADGSLHEIQLALGAMEPRDFAALPPGQRALVAIRLRDLATVDEERLRRAVAALLVELIRLAHAVPEFAYGTIVEYGIEYGYRKQYGDAWIGNGPARAALAEVALTSNKSAHDLIATGAIGLVEGAPAPSHRGWYFHDLRGLLQNLLINPECHEPAAQKLASALQHVNEVSH